MQYVLIGGDLAIHSHRITASKDLVHLGEHQEYQALCRSCFKKKNPNKMNSFSLYYRTK